MPNLLSWLDAVVSEHLDLELSISKIKTKLESKKNIESIVDDELLQLNTLEVQLKQMFN